MMENGERGQWTAVHLREVARDAGVLEAEEDQELGPSLCAGAGSPCHEVVNSVLCAPWKQGYLISSFHL